MWNTHLDLLSCQILPWFTPGNWQQTSGNGIKALKALAFTKACQTELMCFTWSIHYILTVVLRQIMHDGQSICSLVATTPKDQRRLYAERQLKPPQLRLVVIVKGHRNQRGSAPGLGASRFTDHRRDLHRAWKEAKEQTHGWEVGTPGSGTHHHAEAFQRPLADARHNVLFCHN